MCSGVDSKKSILYLNEDTVIFCSCNLEGSSSSIKFETAKKTLVFVFVRIEGRFAEYFAVSKFMLGLHSKN